MRRSLAQAWREQRRAKSGDVAWEESLWKKRWNYVERIQYTGGGWKGEGAGLDVIAVDVWQGRILKRVPPEASCEKKGKENGSDSAFADRGARCRLVGRQGDERWRIRRGDGRRAGNFGSNCGRLDFWRAEHLAGRGNYWRDSGSVCRCGTFGLDYAAA